MKKPKKNNWLTTLGGIAGGVGAILQHMPNQTVKTIGDVLVPAGILILGGTAKDFNVTGVK